MAPRVWVYDTAGPKLVGFDVSERAIEPALQYRVEGPSFSDFRWLSPTRLVANPGTPDHVLAFYELEDGELRLTSRAGVVPLNSDAAAAQKALNLARLTVAPDGRRMVLAFTFSNTLQFYDSDGNLLAQIEGPRPVEQLLREIQADTGLAALLTDDTRLGYMAVDSSNEHAYAFFCGRRVTDFTSRHPSVRPSIQEVHVFDWQGELLAATASSRRAAAVAALRAPTRFSANCLVETSRFA